MKQLQKITWRQLFNKLKDDFYWVRYNEQKAILAFEFAVILSEAAKQLNIEMTREIVMKGEEVLVNEMRNGSAQSFACKMNSLALAVLEPKDII